MLLALAAAINEADPVVQLALAITTLIVVVLVGVVSDLTRRRALKVDKNVGEAGDDESEEDATTVAQHVASTDKKLDQAIDKIDLAHEVTIARDSLLHSRLDHFESLFDARGEQIKQIALSQHEQGERIGGVEQRLGVVEAHLGIPAVSLHGG